jgi:hypothetical protein
MGSPHAGAVGFALSSPWKESLADETQHVFSREELSVVTTSDLGKNPDRYLRPSRPPVFKDYFDPSLRKVLPIPRKLRQVRVNFDVEEADIPSV